MYQWIVPNFKLQQLGNEVTHTKIEKNQKCRKFNLLSIMYYYFFQSDLPFSRYPRKTKYTNELF